MNGPFALVVGSAHLDVLSRIVGDDTTVNKDGAGSFELGGPGCNVACNLAVLGVRARLLTAMNVNSPFSGIVSAYLKSHDIDLRVVHDATLPPAFFSAHIDKDGAIFSAVSSVSIEMAAFPEEIVLEAMNGAACVILECNLSPQTLNQIAGAAAKANIPVFVAAVSEEKSLRLGKISAPIAAVFMNQREAEYFGRHAARSTDLWAVAGKIGGTLVCTRGEDGVIVVAGGEETAIPAIKPFQPDIVQTLGAGDALLAATVAGHVFDELDFVESVRSATAFATQVISQPHCNAGLGRGVENALLELDHKANRDPMTDLLNRAAMTEALTATIGGYCARETPTAVLMLDIDKFKSVNDTYGHDEGDLVIRSVADILRNSLRANDIAGRWGGEEFVCLLLECDEKTAHFVAERIRSKVESTVIGRPGRVTVSIGVAMMEKGASCEDIMKQADTALYNAKNEGRNRVKVHPNRGVRLVYAN